MGVRGIVFRRFMAIANIQTFGSLTGGTVIIVSEPLDWSDSPSELWLVVSTELVLLTAAGLLGGENSAPNYRKQYTVLCVISIQEGERFY